MCSREKLYYHFLSFYYITTSVCDVEKHTGVDLDMFRNRNYIQNNRTNVQGIILQHWVLVLVAYANAYTGSNTNSPLVPHHYLFITCQYRSIY